ncbi:MAG: secretin and TonB N-terminal domain-containing protein [Candidatus Tectomicrobia bacterium]|nr:secretin and TonB N-terminal domain-containing protein [Candidatus Tectomicrobia bacterium]
MKGSFLTVEEEGGARQHSLQRHDHGYGLRRSRRRSWWLRLLLLLQLLVLAGCGGTRIVYIPPQLLQGMPAKPAGKPEVKVTSEAVEASLAPQRRAEGVAATLPARSPAQAETSQPAAPGGPGAAETTGKLIQPGEPLPDLTMSRLQLVPSEGPAAAPLGPPERLPREPGVLGSAPGRLPPESAGAAPRGMREEQPGGLPDLTMSGLQVQPRTAGRRFSLSAQDQEINAVLIRLAHAGGVNLAVDPDVRGRVSVELNEVTLDQALTAILPPLGYAAQRSGGIIWIGRPDLESRTFDLGFLSTQPVTRRVDDQPRDVVDVRARQLVWEELWHALETVIFGGPDESAAAGAGKLRYARSGLHGRRLIMQPRSGLVLIRTTPDNLAVSASLIDRVRNAARRRVAVAGAIVEVRQPGGRGAPGVIEGAPPEKPPASPRAGAAGAAIQRRAAKEGLPATDGLVDIIVSRKSIADIIAALEAAGEVRVVARPRLLVSNNQRAVLKFQHSPGASAGAPLAGLELVVAPSVGEDGSLNIILHPILVSGGGGGESATGEIDTVVVLRPGETLIMSGLVQGLAVAPAAGASASSSAPPSQRGSRSELIILLRATILTDEVEPRSSRAGG